MLYESSEIKVKNINNVSLDEFSTGDLMIGKTSNLTTNTMFYVGATRTNNEDRIIVETFMPITIKSTTDHENQDNYQFYNYSLFSCHLV